MNRKNQYFVSNNCLKLLKFIKQFEKQFGIIFRIFYFGFAWTPRIAQLAHSNTLQPGGGMCHVWIQPSKTFLPKFQKFQKIILSIWILEVSAPECDHRFIKSSYKQLSHCVHYMLQQCTHLSISGVPSYCNLLIVNL